jgi:hypothetical protein
VPVWELAQALAMVQASVPEQAMDLVRVLARARVLAQAWAWVEMLVETVAQPLAASLAQAGRFLPPVVCQAPTLAIGHRQRAARRRRRKHQLNRAGTRTQTWQWICGSRLT